MNPNPKIFNKYKETVTTSIKTIKLIRRLNAKKCREKIRCSTKYFPDFRYRSFNKRARKGTIKSSKDLAKVSDLELYLLLYSCF